MLYVYVNIKQTNCANNDKYTFIYKVYYLFIFVSK